jgi:serine/threonine protein kinase
MAKVHRARDLRLQRPVALKLLRADLASDPVVRARFAGEARSAARLRHPHVVSIFDIGEESGVPFIVMELLPGETLADRIRTGPLAESTVLPLASQVLGALAAAHSAGILHRDLTPANILFDDRGEAKVADFGIAKSMEGGVAATPTSNRDLHGAASYIAPERAEGQPASPASDLWSLGAVLYEALTGAQPFPGDNPLDTPPATRESLKTPLSGLRPDLSPQLVAVVERALAPNPADRFVSAAAMAAALGVGLGSSGPSHGIEESGKDPVQEAGGLSTATRLVPPEEAAAALSAHLLAVELGRQGQKPADQRRRAHRRRRRSRFPRWEWWAVGATAVALVAAIAVGASGVLGGSAGSGTTGRVSVGQRRTGSTPPSSSTTSTPPTTSPATVPPTTAPPVTATPSTTPPPTTAVPPTQPPTTSTTAPTTTAPPPPSTTAPPTTAAPPASTPPTEPPTTSTTAPTTTAPPTTVPPPSTTAPPTTVAPPANPSTTAGAAAAALRSHGNADNPGHAGSTR